VEAKIDHCEDNIGRHQADHCDMQHGAMARDN